MKKNIFSICLEATIMILGFAGITAPLRAVTPCSDLVGSCAYYRCVDDIFQSCGNRGYVLGHAHPFCEKFFEADFPEPSSPISHIIFPTKGNDWRDQVLSCLQLSLDSFLEQRDNADCMEIHTYGFASHPQCYTSSPSICEITPQNVGRIGLIVGIPTLLTSESLTQMRAIANICVDQLRGRIMAENRHWVRIQLEAYQKMWETVALDPLALIHFYDQEKNVP